MKALPRLKFSIMSALALLMVNVGGAAHAQDATVANQDVVIVTLGTAGGPRPRADRAQAANLLIVKGTPYLIDAGENVIRRIVQSGTPFLQVGKVFITHAHSDHTMGLPAFMATMWEFQRRAPVDIYGAVGTTKLVGDALQFLSSNTAIRGSEGNPSPIGDIIKAHDVQPGNIYKDDNVTVTAAENTHFNFGASSPAKDRFGSYSYKFVTSGKTVVFTGDTSPSAALDRLCADADVLVTEVNDVDALVSLYKSNGAWQAKTEEEQRGWLKHQNEEHLSPEAVSALASKARVKQVILTHLTPIADEKAGYAKIVERVQKGFTGKVDLASDLQRF